MSQSPPTLAELLRQERHGALATLSARRDGWPFASAVPYALDVRGHPVFVLSDLAEHTRNARSDPRASLLVQDSAAADDPQAGARVTLLGRLTLASDEDAARARQVYVARHAQAADYASMGDFRIWRLHVDQARYVGGFGDMGWLEEKALHAALAG